LFICSKRIKRTKNTKLLILCNFNFVMKHSELYVNLGIQLC
jgi:hypothetical protein